MIWWYVNRISRIVRELKKANELNIKLSMYEEILTIMRLEDKEYTDEEEICSLNSLDFVAEIGIKGLKIGNMGL